MRGKPKGRGEIVPEGGAAELREKAERLLKEKGVREAGGLIPQEAQELLHELQVHQIELEMQNENLKAAQFEIEQSREKYVDLYDFAPVGYLTVDISGVILEANLKACSMLEVERGLLINKPLRFFVAAEDAPRLSEHLWAVINNGMEEEIELKFRIGKELGIQGLLKSVPWSDSEGNRLCRTSISDITERKRAEDALRKAHDEREVLLKEVHHRVKNNLTIISGLLNLQSKGIEENKYRDMFLDTQLRVKSIALIHDRLYRSEDMSSIPMKDYLRGLVRDMYMAYGANANRILPRIEVESGLKLEVGVAIPCALILSELISNSLKYAFPEERKGELRVSFHSVGHQTYELSVSDNGVGLPEGLDVRNIDSLGLHLVTMLGEGQLRGRLRVSSEGGAAFALNFKVSDKVASPQRTP